MKYIAEIDGREFQIEILEDSHVLVNGIEHEVDFQSLRQHLSYSLLMNGRSFEVNIYPDNGGWEVLLRGRQFSVQVEDERERRLRMAAGKSAQQSGKQIIQAPMPGMVIDVPVSEGDQVKKGQVLIILESMKMQNELRAPRGGKVTRVQATINENVDRKQTLIILE
jgi:biotin carboxyl carrier protein